jgi:hypothetical protein
LRRRTSTHHRWIDPDPVPADRSTVVAREDISVNGEPACSITVRYAGRLDQDVTWNGEPCSEVAIGFMTLAELEKIGQADDLDEETRDDLGRLAGGRALYVEGRFASAIYPLNVAGFPREVWLAD